MKKTSILLLMTIMINSCFLSSSKNDVEPKANEPFYCKVNGVAWRPAPDNYPIGGIGSPNLKFSSDKIGGWFYIQALNNQDYITFNIKLAPNDYLKVGKYNITSDNENKFVYSYNVQSSNTEYLNATSGEIIFSKIDSGGTIGTFEFTVYSERLKKEFKITHGQFKLR